MFRIDVSHDPKSFIHWRNQTTVNVNVFNSRCTLAYVTHEDVSRLSDFQQQTVIVVKAPEETKLVVSPPTQVDELDCLFPSLFFLSKQMLLTRCFPVCVTEQHPGPSEGEQSHRGADLRHGDWRDERLLRNAGREPD